MLIANPAARRAARALPAVQAAFDAMGVRCTTLRTERAGHAAELARALSRDHAAVYVLGGDGTVMEVFGALASSGVAIGIVPGGTGNLVARMLGIPMDAGLAVRRMLRGRRMTIDLGLLGDGRCFAFAAGVGIDARMIGETPGWAKRRCGVAAYVATAAVAALQCRTWSARVRVDDAEFSSRAASVLVANMGSVLGGLVTLGPGIDGADGALDVGLYTPRTGAQALGVAWRMMRGRFAGAPHMMFRRGRVIRVECDPPQPWQADGEMMGLTPFEARIQPGAATVLAAAPDGPA